jgi:antidote-toxin recognition MazE-like antitoxin
MIARAPLARRVELHFRCRNMLRDRRPTMPPARRKSKPKPARERMQARRKRLRAQGLRPVQHWVPDLRDRKMRAAIRREAALLTQHPENAAIDDWIEAAYDPSDRS